MQVSLTRIARLSKITIHAAQNISESQPKRKMALGVFNKPRDKSIFKELGSFVLSKKVKHSKKSTKIHERSVKRARLRPIEREGF
jgi:hypothetical protein